MISSCSIRVPSFLRLGRQTSQSVSAGVCCTHKIRQFWLASLRGDQRRPDLQERQGFHDVPVAMLKHLHSRHGCWDDAQQLGVVRPRRRLSWFVVTCGRGIADVSVLVVARVCGVAWGCVCRRLRLWHRLPLCFLSHAAMSPPPAVVNHFWIAHIRSSLHATGGR